MAEAALARQQDRALGSPGACRQAEARGVGCPTGVRCWGHLALHIAWPKPGCRSPSGCLWHLPPLPPTAPVLMGTPVSLSQRQRLPAGTSHCSPNSTSPHLKGLTQRPSSRPHLSAPSPERPNPAGLSPPERPAAQGTGSMHNGRSVGSMHSGTHNALVGSVSTGPKRLCASTGRKACRSFRPGTPPQPPRRASTACTACPRPPASPSPPRQSRSAACSLRRLLALAVEGQGSQCAVEPKASGQQTKLWIV